MRDSSTPNDGRSTEVRIPEGSCTHQCRDDGPGSGRAHGGAHVDDEGVRRPGQGHAGGAVAGHQVRGAGAPGREDPPAQQVVRMRGVDREQRRRDAAHTLPGRCGGGADRRVAQRDWRCVLDARHGAECGCGRQSDGRQRRGPQVGADGEVGLVLLGGRQVARNDDENEPTPTASVSSRTAAVTREGRRPAPTPPAARPTPGCGRRAAPRRA